jgi:hypothetical protein
LKVSKTRYPNIYAHYMRAIAKGWPRVIGGRSQGRVQAARSAAASHTDDGGFDRDECPAAVGRGQVDGLAIGLVRGINPIGWLADVEYVPGSESRSHGPSLAAKLRKLCDETRIRYAFS